LVQCTEIENYVIFDKDPKKPVKTTLLKKRLVEKYTD